jgi:surface antigen
MRVAPGGVPNDSCVPVQQAPYGGAISLWKAPPAPFDRVYAINPNLYPAMWGYWPTCTWWAHEMRPTYRPGDVNHRDPKVGATIRYMPGVLGAGEAGHVGHVVAVYDDGWILTSEMNFYWRGGGAGRVIFRFVPAHTSGVSYVY